MATTAPALPVAFPAFPIPATDETDFEHVIEHVINLSTPQQRLRITIIAGVTTAEDLL